MKVIVCHRQKTLVHLARINGKSHGVDVTVARNGHEILAYARDHRPDAIVLGTDLENPSTEETIQMLKSEPTLRGVEVIKVKSLPDLLTLKKTFPSVFQWPKVS